MFDKVVKSTVPGQVIEQIKELLVDKARRDQMREALHSLVRLDSAERICDIIEELVKT